MKKKIQIAFSISLILIGIILVTGISVMATDSERIAYQTANEILNNVDAPKNLKQLAYQALKWKTKADQELWFVLVSGIICIAAGINIFTKQVKKNEGPTRP